MDELDPRHQEILRAIVQEHIATGEPVGSQTVASRGLAVSSATVRNAMADLEELGLLEKPHTSAGRIPTDRGYRYYVDSLLQVRPPSRPERELIERSLPANANADELLKETSRLLSSISKHAAVVSLPSVAQVGWHRIEFVRLRDDRLLAVLLSPSGLVRNRLLTVDFPISDEELHRAADYLNSLLSELPAEQLRERLLSEIAGQRTELDALETKAASLGVRVLEPPQHTGGELHIEGQQSFFEAPEFADLKRMRELFHALEEKSKLLQVLDRALHSGDVNIFIGSESEFSARTGASIVAAPYTSPDGMVGSLGIIGPTRMNYSRAIALVEFTAGLVSRMLQRP